jgi:hypothetical protein
MKTKGKEIAANKSDEYQAMKEECFIKHAKLVSFESMLVSCFLYYLMIQKIDL